MLGVSNWMGWMRRGVCGGLAVWQGLVCAQMAPETAPDPAEDHKTWSTRALQWGAKVIQGHTPVNLMDIYLNGFHPMKESPQHQMEAHHYCHQLSEDFAQCVLFDGNGREARLNGVEYIISAALFERLPADEKRYWHPHNGEILSGQLVAPGLPDWAEKELMKRKINSYGKTWHVWGTGVWGMKADPLPYGEPMLAWSFHHEGEANPAMVAQRDRRLGIRSQDKRQSRQELRGLAHPQMGEDHFQLKKRPDASHEHDASSPRQP